jgi:alpha/beta superfamily hydrolase
VHVVSYESPSPVDRLSGLGELEVTLSTGRWGRAAIVPLAFALLLAACSAGHRSTSTSSGRLGARPAGPTIPSTLPSASHRRCLTPQEQRGEVWFDAPDGAHLSGVVLGQGGTGVVLAHQRWFNLCSWMPFVRILAQRGFKVLAFDFRGFGASPPVSGRAGRSLDLDVAGAADYLRRQGVHRVVLAGSSMGATSALMVASEEQPAGQAPIAGVVSISGPSRFYDMDAAAAVRHLRVPLLLIASGGEGSFTRAARLLYHDASSHSKRMVLVPGTVHGIGLLQEPGVGPQIRQLVTTFIEEHAPPDAAS